jgi:hypothetical protein
VDETSTRKLGAEFTTSTSVAKLIEEITSGLDVLDMCCGYGTTLREFRRKTRVRVGQEINHEVATLARLLARVEGYEVEILNEDSLAVCHTDWLRIGFHTVIVDPPMGVRLREDQVSPTDLRWTHSAVARSTQAEDYWIQSALAYLRPSSVEAPFRAVVILRSGWFFDGSGGPFRDALLKAGVVEAVISLGSGTKMSTAIPVSILVLRKAGIGSAKVRMIDATEAGRVRRGVRELELEEIKAIAAAMNGRETGQTISTVKVLDVPIQEVLQNGSVLDVRRYLPNDRSAASLGMAVKELNKVVDLLSKAFRAIGDSLSELNPTGILDVDSMSSSGLQLVKLASDEMQSNLVQSYFKSRRPGEEWSTDDVRPSDVVVSMMGVGAGSAISGRELIAKQPAWTKVWILRTVRERIDPEYLLAWARYGGLETQTRRLISRSTVPTLAMRDIKQISLPVVDFETQKRIAIWGKRLDELSERLLVLGDVQAEFIGAAKGVTSAFFVELDRRESKP